MKGQWKEQETKTEKSINAVVKTVYNQIK